GVVSIDLTLDEQGELLLHGDKGLSQRGPETGNANYYYSLVRQQTSGQIVIDGRTHAVTGLSWMDHEFGAFAPSLGAVGWDWFSATLGDGTVLMFGSFHDNQGDSRSLYGGTLGYPDGRQFALGQDDVELTPLGSWQSPTTAIRYPARWQVRIPKYNLELQITPLVADQEMRVSIVYYEGATAVEGTLDGQPIQGRGYVELTGYGETGAGD
ncbi:MAG: carotenoid 1,2-hydratase, partial [Caldilineaceae bacterium]|nr:carotenoid 1,2-hydratase [Caldilineaceae bacterium]